jgi:hypothetical protein
LVLEQAKPVEIRACQLREGKFSPVYSVPTGTRIFWCADVESDKFPQTYASIRLRRGNELIDSIGPFEIATVAGTSEELPNLSPGKYILALDGFKLRDDGERVPVVSDAWTFLVREPGSEVEQGVADPSKTYRVLG